MNTLNTAPLAPLLDSLFKQMATESIDITKALSLYSDEEQEQLMLSKTEYTEFYTCLKDFPLAVSKETGLLLYILARNSQAKNIVEFGTSFGISTLYLAAALRDNGGGCLITSEFEPTKVIKARQNLIDGGLIDLVDIREGDALQTLSKNLPDNIDILLLDGAKAIYSEVLDLLEKHLKLGAIIIADDANYSPEYLARVRSSNGNYISTLVADNVELSIKVK